jgi:hypothetical protein
MSRTQIITLKTAGAETASTTQDGVTFREVFHQALLMLKVTSAATLVGDTLNVYIDTSPDGGTTWVNIGAFTQVVGNGGAKTFTMALGEDNPGATAVFDVSANASAGATRQVGISDRLRARSVIAGTGSFTYSVTGILK